MSKFQPSAYALHVAAHPAYGPKSSYYRFLVAVDRGQYAKAAGVLAATGHVDGYPVVSALYALGYLTSYPGHAAPKSQVEWRAAVGLLGGSAAPRSAKVSVETLAAYAASLAGEAVYGDY